MDNIMYILVTHLCMYKKYFPCVSYTLQRAVTYTEKQVRVKYRVLGPSKTPSVNTSLTKKIHRHKCIEYSKPNNQMLRVNKFASIVVIFQEQSIWSLRWISTTTDLIP